VNPDGSADVQLTAGNIHAMHPTWSPDGEWIAFRLYSEVQVVYSVVYIAADGSSPAPIPMASPADSPAWRP
jgi:Tol biopolymer transport system component